MKWIKHDTDANQDAKLQNVLLDYGLEGYGLYWYCIELIAGKVDKDNITFELEHDARIISRNTGSTPQKVSEMMRYFVDIGLFEDSQGVVTCLKLARRLDQSMTSNKQMREIIDNFKRHDSVMIKSDEVMQEEITLEEIKRDNSNSNLPTDGKPPAKKKKFNDDDVRFAEWFYQGLLANNPDHKKPNFESSSWADSVRLMREQDGRTYDQMASVFKWAASDSFWKSNILCPQKLRKQFDALVIKMEDSKANPRPQPRDVSGTNYAADLIEKLNTGSKRF